MVFRDDREAMRLENDALRRELDQTRRENHALRESVSQLAGFKRPEDPRSLYVKDPRTLTEGERVLLGEHGLRQFPPWLAALLHLITFGLFSVIHFGMMHGRLPRVAVDDPSSGRAVGLMFVPYWNFYWLFFSPLRLADRINLQFALRDDPRRVWKGPIVFGAVLSLFMYFVPVAWLIAVYQTQKRVNELVALGAVKPAQRTVEADELLEQRTGVRMDGTWAEAPAPYAPTDEAAEGDAPAGELRARR